MCGVTAKVVGFLCNMYLLHKPPCGRGPEVSQLSKFGGVGLMTADVVLCCRLQYMQYAVCGYTALGDMQSMVSVEVTRYGVFCLQLAGLGVE